MYDICLCILKTNRQTSIEIMFHSLSGAFGVASEFGKNKARIVASTLTAIQEAAERKLEDYAGDCVHSRVQLPIGSPKD